MILKSAHRAVEERARSELGMVKDQEQFYQVIQEDNNESMDAKV